MKLYELHCNSYFKINDDRWDQEVFLFDHIDGMYSVCYDKDKNLIHIGASTEVELANDNLQ